MSKIRSGPWLTGHASSGLRDLPRSGALLASKILGFAADVEASVSDVAPERLRGPRTAAPDALPGASVPVDVGLKQAEAALAAAKTAERRAWTGAQNASACADIARSIGDEGRQRVRQATGEAQREVDRRTQQARDQFERLIERERQQASRDAAVRLEQVTAEVDAQLRKARTDAEEADANARRQLASARVLAAEATAAARDIADQTLREAKASADEAVHRARSADQIFSDARDTEQALTREAARAVREQDARDVSERLTEYTKAELLDIAQPLHVQAAARMTKDQLVTAIRDASRATART
jgi:colicin import membrane protein